MDDSALSQDVSSSSSFTGRALERLVWRYRSYVHPAHIWTYWSILRQQRNAPAENAPRRYVLFDFTRVEIDNISGRYLFSLVRDFESLGLVPCYRKNFRFLASMRHRRFKRLLLNRPFRVCESVNELPEGSVAAEVTDRRGPPGNPKHRQIVVKYEARWPQSEHEIPLSFFVHPQIHNRWLERPAPNLAERRPWRVFFSGRALDPKYRTDVLPRKFGKMSRSQMLQALEAALPAARLKRIEQASDLEPGAVRHPSFVWADLGGYQIPQKDWLDVLDRADFFLACPGMGMPLCHNLIESLSRGAVPILEHPEFLDPELEHNVNCLVFRGRHELIKMFDHVFELSPEEIQRLREGAYAYYQNHLAPGRFAHRLLSVPGPRVNLLFNAYRVPRPACYENQPTARCA